MNQIYLFMAQLGNKNNAYLNGEWGVHVKKDMKKFTSHIRRQYAKKEIEDRLKNE